MAYFLVTDGRDTIVFQILDPAQIDHARALIAGTTTDSARIGGTVTVAPADHNIGWSYFVRAEDVTFYDMSAEVYDAAIHAFEDHVQTGRPLDQLLPHNLWLSWQTTLVLEFNAISGTDNAETLTGTAAADIMFGEAGDDVLLGHDGIDHLIGGLGADWLAGGIGADKLSGGDGIDRLDGGQGNDVLDGGPQADAMHGGTGSDVYFVDSTRDQTVEVAGEGIDLIKTSVSLTLLPNVENLRLLGFADLNGTGNELDNVITGNVGANRLIGLAGDDRLHGGEGNDRLDGGLGVDRMYGGSGNDSYIVRDATDYVHENYGGGIDSVYASVTHALRANVERLYLTGTAAVNGTGNDLANRLVGNDAANLLRGLAGSDVLRGAGGDDRIEGGTGRDDVHGGTGADQFVFRTGDFGGATAATADIVRDFSQADGDVINLDAVDANSMLAGLQEFTFIGTAAFSGTAGELRYHQGASNTFISGDTNGDGTADFVIRLDGLHALTSCDFIL